MMISSRRLRLSCVRFSLDSDSFLRFLYFATPAASSNNARRSSGFASANAEMFPCDMMERESLPRPVSITRLTISFKRQGALLMKYSPSPLVLCRRRVTSTSSNSTFMIWRELSNTSVTSAILTALRAVEPLKMTSLILFPRNDFTLCSPSTQRIASLILLFPHPFGPTIPITSESKVMMDLSAKDLKPCSSIRFKNIDASIHLL